MPRLGEVVRQLVDETDIDGPTVELDLRSARVLGDPELLRTLAANLLDNAIRHNSADGWIEIPTETVADRARLEISNSGLAITAEEAASLTEPFRRLGAARTGDGLGLGLSIATSVAQAHGGQLAIEPLQPGGLRVAISLPTLVRPHDLHPARASLRGG